MAGNSGGPGLENDSRPMTPALTAIGPAILIRRSWAGNLATGVVIAFRISLLTARRRGAEILSKAQRNMTFC